MNLTTTRVFTEVVKAINEGYKIIVLEGSTRSTKSYSANQVMDLLSIKQPKSRNLFVAVTLQIAKRNLLNDFKKIIGKDWRKFGNFKISEMTYEWRNESETLFLSAENWEKYHGLKSDNILLDEPNLYKEGGKLLEQLEIRCSGVIILTMNPSRKLDWLKEIMKRDDCKYIHSTYKDNRFLEQTTIDRILARAKVDERFRMVYVEGKYVANIESAIFTNWNVSDFYPTAEQSKKVVYGLDFGFANDPSSLVEVSLYDSKIYVRELFRDVKMTTLQIAAELDKLPNGAMVIADNSEPRLVVEIRTLLGARINLLKTRKFKGSILTGIKKLQSQEIVINSKSADLIEEFELYSWKKTSGVLTDTPEDKNNHGIDALRYAYLHIDNNKIKTWK